MKNSEGEKPIDRLGARHRCFFEDMTVEVTPVKSEIHGDKIFYTEASRETNLGLNYFVDFVLMKKEENLTHTVIKIGTAPGQELPPEMAAMVFQNIRASIEHFKIFCESRVN